MNRIRIQRKHCLMLGLSACLLIAAASQGHCQQWLASYAPMDLSINETPQAEAKYGWDPAEYIGPQNTEVDYSKYQQLVYVSQSSGSDTSGNGTMSNPWAKVSYALSRLNDGGPDNRYAVLVAEGEYVGNPQRHSDSDPVDDPTRFHMRPFVDLYGGFDPATWNRDIYTYWTVLDGENQHRVVYGEDNATLDGFVVTKGFTNYQGGGILCNGTSPEISNNFVVSNESKNGGGILALESESLIQGNYIALNVIGEYNQLPYIEGGGISSLKSSLVFSGNVVRRNRGLDAGGGGFDEGDNTIVNNIFTENWGDTCGGICSSDGRDLISNCVIVNNQSFVNGNRQVTLTLGDDSVLLNSVVFGRLYDDRPVVLGEPESVSYCFLQSSGLFAANETNIYSRTPPWFPNEATFRLPDNSPLIDAGDPTISYYDACSPPGLGDPRNDIGAYGGPFNCGGTPNLSKNSVSIPKGLAFEPEEADVLNVPVNIGQLKGVSEVYLLIGYDEGVVEASTPTLSVQGSFTDLVLATPGLLSCTVEIQEPTANSGSGTLLTIPFGLADQAQAGESTVLSFLDVSLLDTQGNGFILDEISHGSIYIAYDVIVYGDVDSSGDTDVMDVMMVLRDIADIEKLSGDAFDRANIGEPHDDRIDIIDAMAVFDAALGTE